MTRNVIPSALIFMAGCALAQNESGPTFSAGTRLVQVDVVAHSKGAPAAGLTKEDFTLFDNGKPQTISFFSVRSARTRLIQTGGPNAVPLPPGAVTNRLDRGTERNNEAPANATVLLIDQKNTPQAVQGFAIQRIVRFVQMRRKGDRIGIYTFGKDGKLLAVQGVTDDQELLSRAANSLRARDPSYRDLDLGGMTSHAADGVKALEFQERGTDTKIVLEAITRNLAGVPGRKSLVWVTTSFPLFAPDLGIDFRPDMEEAARVLNDANVALYAVDAHGIIGASGLIAISNAEAGGPQSSAQLRQQMSATGAKRVPDPFDAPGAGVDTMNMLAGLTGGLVFYNQSNAIEESIQTAVNDADASSTYTLGFYPADSQDRASKDRDVHSLKVKVAKRGVSVRYRESYSASLTPAAATDRPTIEQLLKDPLDATQLQLVAETMPDPARPGFLQVRVSIDLRGVQLEDQNNTWVGTVDVAFLIEGSQTARTISTKVEIPDAQLAVDLEKGIVVNDSIEVKGQAGELRRVLHVVARDRASGAAGSVRVQVGRR
jgi:VWFA-related protein